MRNRQLPFWLLAVALLVGLTLPVLIQDGMFMDAMLYTSVSHNLSQGIGTFWFPQMNPLGDAGLPSFHEQPPLAFGIQAVFFKLLGDSLYTERVYTFLMLCLAAALIVALWRNASDRYDTEALAWLPLVYWIIIPVCFWSYQNNMNENTMGIFTLSAVIMFYRTFGAAQGWQACALVAGALVVLATLCKGVPGLFPLAAPALYWACTRRISFRKAASVTLLSFASVAVLYAAMLSFPDSRESLKMHFVDRALFRIHQNPTVDSRFYILGRLFTELLPPLLLTAICFAIGRQRGVRPSSDRVRLAVFFIALGFAGSAPLMLTMVQKGFYFVPSLPMFAVGLSLLSAPFVANAVSHLNTMALRRLTYGGIALVAVAVGLTVYNCGGTSRNKDILNDVYLFGRVVPRYSIVRVNPEAWDDWDLQCYLMRYYNVALTTTADTGAYFILDRQTPGAVPPGYVKLNMPTQRFELYRR